MQLDPSNNSSFKTNQIIFDLFDKFILLPQPHLAETLIKHIDDKCMSMQFNEKLLDILDHSINCFRSYALLGEILPLLLIFKPKEEKFTHQLLKSNRLQHFSKNIVIEPAFYKRGFEGDEPYIVPSFAKFLESSTFIECDRIDPKVLEKNYLLDNKSQICEYVIDNETGILIYLVTVPILLSNEKVNDILLLKINISYMETDYKDDIETAFKSSDNDILNYLIKDKDAFYIPHRFSCSVEKEITLLTPFVVSYSNEQNNSKNAIAISIKHNSLAEEKVEDNKIINNFLKSKCQQDQCGKENDFCIKHIEFIKEKSSVNWIFLDQETQPPKISIGPYFSQKMYKEQGDIIMRPHCEQTILIILEKNQQNIPEQLRLKEYVTKCEFCKQKESGIFSFKDGKYRINSLQKLLKPTTLSPTRRVSSINASPTPLRQSTILNDTNAGLSQISATQPPSKEDDDKLQNSAIKNRQTQLLENQKESLNIMDNQFKKQLSINYNPNSSELERQHSDDGSEQDKQCKCWRILNENLNLNITTPLMIRWKALHSKLNSISIYKINWKHQGQNIIEVTLKTKKDDKFKTDQWVYIVMDVKNTSAKALDLECMCPEKILSTLEEPSDLKDKTESDFSINQVVSQPQIVAVSMQKTIAIGHINPGQIKETKLEYYIINRGVFYLKGLDFYDNISGEKIFVDISLIQSIDK